MAGGGEAGEKGPAGAGRRPGAVDRGPQRTGQQRLVASNSGARGGHSSGAAGRRCSGTHTGVRLSPSPPAVRRPLRAAQVYALFSRVGHVQRVIMGLDSQRKTPCGFCFVVYDRRDDALAAVRYLSGTSLDERPIRVDIDYGFEEGRQFGRGRSGGQVRDEFRTDYDSARGGFGKQLVKQIQSSGLAIQETDAGVAFVPLGGAAAAPQAQQGGGGGAGGQQQQQEQEQQGADQEQEEEKGGGEGGEGGSEERGRPRGGDDNDDGRGGQTPAPKRRRVGSAVGVAAAAQDNPDGEAEGEEDGGGE
ncbi:MAG: hypothetical protein J3K34DRAFT_13665 [Monoraphidium minutum]|nr:MAG: hypothetical protein J3K34DRAFT_13665 [Monoraphidium minutum]